MDIQVLGTGCAKCKAAIALIEQVAHAGGVPSREKIEQAHSLKAST